MKNLIGFLKKPYVYGIMAAIILISSFAYTLMDAFVIEKAYSIAQPTATGSQTQENTQGESQNSTQNNNQNGTQNNQNSTSDTLKNASVTDSSYQDNHISIQIEKVSKNNAVFYVADIRLSDASYLKTAFARGTFGKNITDTTSQIASDNHAIFAINGDYYGFRDNGLVIRNGKLYRDKARSAPANEALALYSDGQMKIIKEGEKTGEEYLKDGVVQTFSFGPTLVRDGKAVESSILKETSLVPTSDNPRTAIGQIEPLHYIFIVVDGRSQTSAGMTLSELAQEFVDRGCTVAYNLDGGGSSTMFYNGGVINSPTDGRHDGERNISDIIYLDGSDMQ